MFYFFFKLGGLTIESLCKKNVIPGFLTDFRSIDSNPNSIYHNFKPIYSGELFCQTLNNINLLTK